MHAASKEYAIVRRRSKSSYKFGKTIKVAINCERDDHPRRKPGAKQKRIGSIKIECPFRVNALYKESLDLWTMKVRHAEHNHKEDEVPNAFATLRKKNKTTNLLATIDSTIKANK